MKIEIPDQLIALQRKNPLVRGIADICWLFLRAFENYTYEMDCNGELRLLEVLAKHPGFSRVIDVGANVGEWTDHVLRLFPDAHVTCFDPAYPMCQHLLNKYMGHMRVSIETRGLSDSNGTKSFNVHHDKSTLSSLVKVHHGNWETVEVAFTTGDAFLEESGANEVDILKIDTEGHDLYVLKGFANALQRRAIKVIQFEYNNLHIFSNSTLYQMYQLLAPHGYVLGKVCISGVEFRKYHPQHETYLGPNYVAVRDDLKDIIKALE